MADEEFYTLQEVADLLKVTYRTVIRWVEEGQMPAYKVGPNTWRVGKDDLQKFLKERRRGQ